MILNTTNDDRVAVAGGGGGGGIGSSTQYGGYGGIGGGTNGSDGQAVWELGGGGASQAGGGAAGQGSGPNAGILGSGGEYYAGGGGGGGYYGGGSSGESPGFNPSSGGGGGSGYAESAASSVTLSAGKGSGNGSVIIGTGNDIQPDGGPVGKLEAADGGPGTECVCLDKSGKVAEPINAMDGDFYDTNTDLSVPGPGVPLAFTRNYRRCRRVNGKFKPVGNRLDRQSRYEVGT